MMNESSQYWWINSQFCSNRSPWLQSTLSELDAKTKALLKLIEQDADSFAQRAEMYYKKRPELVTMVEGFYRSQRALAESYDHLRSEHGKSNLTAPGSPFWSGKPVTPKYQLKSEPCSESCVSDEYPESDIEDPELETETNSSDFAVDDEQRFDEETHMANHDEMVKLNEEIERLREGNRVEKEELNKKDEEMVKLNEEIERLSEENRVQKEELNKKDEEKREVIRQMSLAVEILKEDNLRLRKRVVAATKEESPRKLWSPVLEFKNLRDGFLEKLVKPIFQN